MAKVICVKAKVICPPACHCHFLEREVLTSSSLRHELAWPDDVPINFVRSLSI